MINYPFAIIVAVYVVSFVYLYQRYRDRLAFHKYLSNHALWFAPINFLFVFFTHGRANAVFAPATVPGLDKIKQNYPLIREEAKAMFDGGAFQRPPSVDDPGFNSFEKGGYRTYRLKWYTNECTDAAVARCPQTCGLLDSVPAIRSALFTVLPPGGQLGRHHDPLASSLRYHLGLLTPNSDKCALTLDGVAHPWRDGEELLFDQTYLHSAVNNTDTPRVILFCDVDKTQLVWPIGPLANAFNMHVVVRLTSANEKGKLSWVSQLYKPIYKVRSFVKDEIRPRSRLAYDVIKYGSLALLIGLVYWAVR
jgi:beta-hydroxylase